MAEELESQGQKATAEDPWQLGEGDPWNKTHEGLKVSDSPVSEDGTSRVPPEPQTEE